MRYSTLRNNGGHIVYHGTEPWTVDNGVYDCADTFDDSDNVFIGDMFVFGNDRDHITFVITDGKYGTQFGNMIRKIVVPLRNTYPEAFPTDMGLSPFIVVPVGNGKFVLIDDDMHGEMDINGIYVMACTGYEPGCGDIEVVGEPVVVADVMSISGYVAAIKTCVEKNGWA